MILRCWAVQWSPELRSWSRGRIMTDSWSDGKPSSLGASENWASQTRFGAFTAASRSWDWRWNMR